MLNVKAEGYAISTPPSYMYTSPEGQEESLPVGQEAKRVIDFGRVCTCMSVCTASLNTPQAVQSLVLVPPSTSYDE